MHTKKKKIVLFVPIQILQPPMLSVQNILTFPKRHNLESPKLKNFADDNFTVDDNGRKLFKQVENAVKKGEIAHYEQFLLFPQSFQKT